MGWTQLGDGDWVETADNATGFLCCTWADSKTKTKVDARVTPVSGGGQVHLGRFNDPEQAAKAVAAFKRNETQVKGREEIRSHRKRGCVQARRERCAALPCQHVHLSQCSCLCAGRRPSLMCRPMKFCTL